MKKPARLPSRRPQEEGFALLAAIVFMVIIAGMGASVASMAEKQSGAAANVIAGNQAFLAADAGLEVVRAKMTREANCTASSINGSTTSGNSTTLNVNFTQAGSVAVNITKNGTGYVIQSSGVDSTMGGSGLRKQQAVWNVNTCTQSGNSTGGDDIVKLLTGYPSSDFACGDSRAVTLPSLNPSTFPSAHSSGSSKTVTHDSSEKMGPGDYKEIKVGKNGSLEFEDDDDGDNDGRTYVKKDLSAKKNSVLILAPGDYYFADDIKLGKNVTVKIDPPGEVNFFVKKNFTIGSGSDINADGAGTFKVQMYDKESKLSVGSQSNFKGVVIAPGSEAKVTFNEGSNVEGAILTGGSTSIGSNVTFKGSVLSKNDIKVKQGTVVTGVLAANDDVKVKKNSTITGCMEAGDDLSLNDGIDKHSKNEHSDNGWHGDKDDGRGDKDNDKHSDKDDDKDKGKGKDGKEEHGDSGGGSGGSKKNFDNGATYTYQDPPELPSWMTHWGGTNSGTSGAVSRSNEVWQDPV